LGMIFFPTFITNQDLDELGLDYQPFKVF